MCQLTFSDLQHLNPLYLTNQLILNAIDNNPDGVGLVTEGYLWKSKHNACLITDLGTCMNKHVTSDPVLAHVRLASNKWLDKIEHTHPFKGKLMAQAHNGRLEPKDKTIKVVGEVDSLTFLNYIEKYWESNPNLEFPELLTKVMEEWEGKFALLYYVEQTNDYYIARGESADLYYTYVNGRIVVNTSKETLDDSLHLLDQISQVLYKTELSVDKIKMLEKNSIFKFDRENSKLEKVGEIKENKLAFSSIVVYDNYNDWESFIPSSHSSLADSIKINGLTLEDADFLSTVTMGCSLLELNSTEITSFTQDVLKVLTEKIDAKCCQVWELIRMAGLSRTAYDEGLAYPWMFSDLDKLLAMATKLGIKHDLST